MEDGQTNSSTHSVHQLFFPEPFLWAEYCTQYWDYNKYERGSYGFGLYGPYSQAAIYCLSDTVTQDQAHMLVYNMRCALQNSFIHSAFIQSPVLRTCYNPNTLIDLQTTTTEKFLLLLKDFQSDEKYS